MFAVLLSLHPEKRLHRGRESLLLEVGDRILKAFGHLAVESPLGRVLEFGSRVEIDPSRGRISPFPGVAIPTVMQRHPTGGEFDQVNRASACRHLPGKAQLQSESLRTIACHRSPDDQ